MTSTVGYFNMIPKISISRSMCKIIIVILLYCIIANIFMLQYYLDIIELNFSNTNANISELEVETQITDWPSIILNISTQSDFNEDNVSSIYQLHYLNLWHPAESTTDVESNDPGEGGRPVVLNDSQQIEMKERFSEHQFNIIASEMISFNRSLLDFRPINCLTKRYPTLLPATSIIIVFYNEAWSTLLRTIWSIINRSPRSLVKEIILVDDGSKLGKY